jgi:uncharacterized protein (DUF433 family)
MAQENKLLKRITLNPRVMMGKPVIAGTRLTVHQIIGLLAQGMETAEIIHEYPHLKKEDILACLLFVKKMLEEREKLIIKLHQDTSKILKKLENLFEKTPVEFRDTSEEDLLTIINSEIEETRKKPARHPSRKSRA